MRETVGTYTPFRAIRTGTGKWCFRIQGDPIEQTAHTIDAEGNQADIVSQSVRSFLTEEYQFQSQSEAEAWIEANWNAVYNDLVDSEDAAEAKAQAILEGSEAQANLSATDYASKKCLEEGKDFETSYPGLKEKRIAWRAKVHAMHVAMGVDDSWQSL